MEVHKVIYDKLQIQINTLYLHFYIHIYGDSQNEWGNYIQWKWNDITW